MNNPPLTRFSVSMPEDLMQHFDQLLQANGYDNRSEAIRDLIRKALLAPGHWGPAQQMAGTIVLVYDHECNELPGTLTELQHRYHSDILSTTHIHLNHSRCMEIIVVRGPYGRLRQLANLLQVLKGVVYAELSVTHLEASESLHDHAHQQDEGGPSCSVTSGK